MKKISIIVPIYNEEEVIPTFLQRLKEVINSISHYDFEILFVNDGSYDNSLTMIKQERERDTRINYVSFSRNFGKENALIAGVDYCTGDAAIFIDVDLQDPPELIKEMIHYWEEGYDDVYAQRRTRKGETWFKKFTAKMYYRVLQSLTRVPIQKDTGDFRLLDRRCINALKKMRETGRNSKSIFSWIGYKKKAILYDREPRAAGKTKWNYKQLTNLAIDGITSFTISPLRVSMYIAIPTLVVFVLYFLYCLYIWNFIDHTALQNSNQVIILLILFFSGIQILLIGIIGEYLGRIFNESKHRPLYLVDEYNGEKEKNE